MPDDEAEAEAEAPQDPPEANDADSLVPVYSNWARPISGRFDLTIDFGWRPGLGPVHWQARVVLSWEEVRVLSDVLRNQIGFYEEIVGSIRDVEGVTMTSIDDDGAEGSDDDEVEDEDADADER